MKRIIIGLLILLVAVAASVGLAQDGGYSDRHDMNDDGVLDHLDIKLYVAYVSDNYGATEEPTPEPEPTATPELEPAHDTRAWHGWDGDHEHKDNPHAVDDVFGTQIYEWAGGAISYPWQTPDENAHKHEDYGWVVFEDIPPDWTNDGAIYIRNLRAQLHMDLHADGAVTRFHSAWVEVEACRRAEPSICGIARYGGWQDYGELRVDGNWIPLGDIDPVAYDGVEPPAVPERDYDNLQSSRGHREEDPHPDRVDWTGRFASQEALGLPTDADYAPHVYSGFNHFTRDARSYLTVDEAFRITGVEPTGGDNTTKHIRSFVLRVREDTAIDGRITWVGYTYRGAGRVNPDCTAPGLDCVPQVFEGFPLPDGQSVTIRFQDQRTEYGP